MPIWLNLKKIIGTGLITGSALLILMILYKYKYKLNYKRYYKPNMTFNIMTFNLLCPYWNNNEKLNDIKWIKRNNDILNTFKNNKIICDIYCFQEMWCDNIKYMELYNAFFNSLKNEYKLYWLKRGSNKKPDGVGMFINMDKFNIIFANNYDIGNTNRVLQLVCLKHKDSNYNILVGNTHLTFPEDNQDRLKRKAQINDIINKIESNINEAKNDHEIDAVILCGDFNCNYSEHESQTCIENGFQCSFREMNNKYLDINPVTHYNHNKQKVGVDYIFYKS